MRTHSRLLLSVAFALLNAAGCGDDGGGGDSGDNPGNDGGSGNGDGGNGPLADAGPRTYGDATPGGPCEPEEAQCGNCIDDDGDDFIDGDDPQCAGPLDNDEATFATGIPGDNKDKKKQDCFFDGNSGGQCQIETCCLLTEEACEEGDFGTWPPNDCAFNMQCISQCIGLVPPGCDCFGCCTICNPETDVCADVMTNPAVSPDCDVDDIMSPTDTGDCVLCEKFDACSVPCEPDGCILCPGQSEDDLPDDCNEMNECPGGETPCDESADCGNGQYCSNHCCVEVVE